MAENEAQTQTTEIVSEVRRQNNPNPIFSLFQNLQLFKFPQFNRYPPKSDQPGAVSELPTRTVGGSEAEEETKPIVVKLPQPRTDLPSLKLEAEECEQNTNPIVLWQVYAIGGFFVLRWVIARWNERRAKKKSSDEEPSPDGDA